MPGQLLMLGPFSGGYANASSLGEVQENQLTELINMNVSHIALCLICLSTKDNASSVATQVVLNHYSPLLDTSLPSW